MPDPKPGEAPASKLPKATLERWEQIVVKAARSGTDIAQLVQHFAEQSYQNKVALLETQGGRRRALGQMHHTIEREAARAEAAHKAHVAAAKTDKLSKPYPAVRIDFLPPDTGAKDKEREPMREPPRGLTGEKPGCKVVPQLPHLASASALERYAAALRDQAQQTQKEMAQIDSLLNKGVRNHQAVVEELAQTSRELYRVAQQVVAKLPPGTGPQAMGGAEETKTYAEESQKPPVAKGPAGNAAGAAVDAAASVAGAAAGASKAMWDQALSRWNRTKGQPGEGGGAGGGSGED